MAKKTTNFNELRPVIITAHKAGNTKAITRDMVQGADIDIRFYNEWVKDVNALRATVGNYLDKKYAKKYGYTIDGNNVTKDDLFAAKELIYPKWKEVLQVGEVSKNDKELCVDDDDIEELIGFVNVFMNSGKGTVRVHETEQLFRKKVESMLGCAIAKNAVLSDIDRDNISEFRSAEKRVQNAIDKIEAKETERKNYKIKLDGLPQTEVQFREYLENMITDCDTELRALKESKLNAEADVKKYSKEAQTALNRIRYAE